MRFIFKTHYDQDIRLVQHGGHAFWYGLLLALLLVFPLVASNYLLGQATLIGIYAIAGLGLMVLTGYTFAKTCQRPPPSHNECRPRQRLRTGVTLEYIGVSFRLEAVLATDGVFDGQQVKIKVHQTFVWVACHRRSGALLPSPTGRGALAHRRTHTRVRWTKKRNLRASGQTSVPEDEIGSLLRHRHHRGVDVAGRYCRHH